MGKLIHTKSDGTKVNPSKNKSPNSPKLQQGDALIIGAGFSKAITNQAPTMSSFLKYALKNEYYCPDDRHSELKKAVTHFYGDEKGVKPNIEELATLLDSESNSLHQYVNKDLAYDQLLNVIKSTLSNVFDGAKESDDFYLYQKLAKECVDLGIPIISFNYDLLLDNLLAQTGKWNPLYGYGSSVKLTTDDYLNGMNLEPLSQKFSSSDTKTVLLKMHGSLNWGLRNIKYPDGGKPIEINPSDVLKDIIPSGLDGKDYYRIRPIENSVVAKGDPIGINYRYEPFVIPPLSSKDSLYRHPFIKHTWYAACQAIMNSKRIFMVGYSMPPGDFEVRNLLLEGMSLNIHGNKTILIINPDENGDVLDRVESLRADKQVHHLYKGCVEWLQDAYDGCTKDE